MLSRRRNRKLLGQRDRFRAILQYELFRRHTAGKISDYELEKSLAASNSNRFIHKIMLRYDSTADTGLTIDADWDSIIGWFQEHWDEILQIIMALVMVFMDEGDHERS